MARLLLRTFVMLLILLAGAVAWLHILGVPRFALDHIQEQASQAGLRISLHRVFLKIHKGVRIEGLVVHHPSDPLTALARAREIDILPNLSASWRSRSPIGRVLLRGGSIRESLPLEQGGGEISLHDITTDISLHPQQLLISAFNLETLGVRFDVAGTVHLPPPRTPSDPLTPADSSRSIADSLGAVLDVIRNQAVVFHHIKRVTFRTPPEVRIRLDLDPARLEASHIRLTMNHSGGIDFQGIHVRNALLEADLIGEVSRITKLSLTGDNIDFQATGLLDFNRMLLTLDSSLKIDSHDFLALMPASIAQDWKQRGVDPQGMVAAEIDWKEVPVAELLRHGRGSLRLDRLVARNVSFDNVAVEFTLSPDSLMVPHLEAMIGEGEKRGPVSGTLSYSLADGLLESELNGGFAVRALLPLIEEDDFLHELFLRIDFRDRPADMNFAIKVRRGDPSSLELRGDIKANGLIYRGVPLDTFLLRVEVAHRVTRLLNLHATRGDEFIKGFIVINNRDGLLDLNLESTMHPGIWGRIAGSMVERRVLDWDIVGPSHTRVEGRIGLDDSTHSLLNGRIQAGRISRDLLHIDRVTAYFSYIRNKLSIPHIEGFWHDGAIKALVFVDNMDAEEQSLFVHATITDASMPLITQEYTRTIVESGTLSLSAQIETVLPDPDLTRMTGSGMVEIHKSPLFKIPILGGLSRYLSNIVRGFGYLSQSDFTSDLAVRDGHIDFQNARLLGTVISVFGDGSVSFSKRLNFKVQVKLMREGLLAEAVQLISWPITKLFEFKLGGTLEDPTWRPENLPKELFLKF